MKKFTRFTFLFLFLVAIGITTLFHFASFSFPLSNDPRQFSSCDEYLQKSSNGTKTALTQSEPDQHPSPSGTCSGCHSGGSTTPSVTISANPEFGAGDTYVPGETYTITYQVTGYSKFGFDLEMNDGNSANSMTAGTLSAVTNTRYTAKPYNIYPANITHNSPISSSSSAVFQWVAPSSPTTVYLFSNALGVNGNGSTSGDKEVFKNMILNPEITSSTSELEINQIKGLYPNPTNHFLTVEYQLKNNGVLNIEIIDLSGKTILNTVNQNLTDGFYSNTIDVSNLSKGTYLLRLSFNNQSQVKRFIVE